MSAWATVAPVEAAPLSAIISEQRVHREQERADAAIARELEASQREADAAAAAVAAVADLVVADADDADAADGARRLSTSSSTSSSSSLDAAELSTFDLLDDATAEFHGCLSAARIETLAERKRAEEAAREQLLTDAEIAAALQRDYDEEYSELQKHRREQLAAGAATTAAFIRPRRYSELDADEATNDDDDDEEVGPAFFPSDPSERRYFDKFEQNSTLYASIPKRGFIVNARGERITKHDAHINGIRNAGRVMHMHPDVATGDTGASDIRLDNRVFNSISRQVHKQSRNATRRARAHDRREDQRTATGLCLDKQSMVSLYKHIDAGVLAAVNQVIATGKEAVVVHADGGVTPLDDGQGGEGEGSEPRMVPRECAVKIFRNSLRLFGNRGEYENHHREDVGEQKAATLHRIREWTEREFSNLVRLQRAGVRCPEPLLQRHNYVLMAFVGEGGVQAPRLKDVRLSGARAQQAYDDVVADMGRMFRVAGLVHADLSEYNVLYWERECWVVDVAQAVDVGHPGALEYLRRDCENVNRVS